jgi:hypothetical protein
VQDKRERAIEKMMKEEREKLKDERKVKAVEGRLRGQINKVKKNTAAEEVDSDLASEESSSYGDEDESCKDEDSQEEDYSGDEEDGEEEGEEDYDDEDEDEESD